MPPTGSCSWHPCGYTPSPEAAWGQSRWSCKIPLVAAHAPFRISYSFTVNAGISHVQSSSHTATGLSLSCAPSGMVTVPRCGLPLWDLAKFDTRDCHGLITPRRHPLCLLLCCCAMGNSIVLHCAMRLGPVNCVVLCLLMFDDYHLCSRSWFLEL